MKKKLAFLIVLVLVVIASPFVALAEVQSSAGLSRDNPQPFGQELLTSGGVSVKVTDYIRERDVTIGKPGRGNVTVLVKVEATNDRTDGRSVVVSRYDFYLTGSSNEKIHPTLESRIGFNNTPEPYENLYGYIEPGETVTGYIGFHVPKDEKNLVLVRELIPYPQFDKFDRFFQVD
jgi:hypothetical protein